MTPSRPCPTDAASTHRVVRGLRSALHAGCALLPMVAVGYLELFQNPALKIEDHAFHEVAIALSTLLGGFIAYVAWRCYASSGEPFQRWLTLGFAGFTVVYAWHGLLTPLAHEHLLLFLLYGPASRFVMAACLLLGMLQYGRPPEPVRGAGYWLGALAALLAVSALVALLAHAPFAGSVRLVFEGGAIALYAATLAAMEIRRVRPSPVTTLCTLALCFCVESSFAFLLGRPWNHQWWLAHAIFAGGFLLLAYGVISVFLTTGSFSRVFSQEELVSHISDAHAATAQALARAEEANRALAGEIAASTRARQKFESLFAMAPDATLVVGGDGRVRKANARAAELFGYPADSFVGVGIEELVPEAQRPAHRTYRAAYRQRPVARMMSPNQTLAGRRRDGSSFLTEISLGPIAFNGEPCTIAIVRDVTAARAFAEQLHVSEQRFRDTFRQAPIGMALLGLDGRFSEVNDALCTLFGYTRDELLTMTANELAAADARAEAPLPELRDGEQDRRYVHRCGQILRLRPTLSVLRDAYGVPLYGIAQFEDVGERHRLEAERAAHQQRAIELSRRLVTVQEEERQRLALELHDVASPNLAAALLNLQLLQHGLAQPADGELAARLQDTRALIAETNTCLRQIGADLRPTLLDYGGLSAALADYAQNFASRTGLAVHFSDSGGDDPRLPADVESLLFRIAQEALTNCAKHAQAAAVSLELAHDGRHACLEIADDGVGFAPEQLGKDGGKPGLGLLTMGERAEFAGGRFRLDSRPGAGTRITVEI